MSLRKGALVEATPEAFRGAAGFTAYEVVAVHKDGTVDLVLRGEDRKRPIAEHVKTRHLTVIHH